jgi:hypothetical protein
MSAVNALLSICAGGVFVGFLVIIVAGTLAYAARTMIEGFDI